MGILKNIFRKKETARGDDDGEVNITADNQLTSKGEIKVYNCKCSIDEIQYAYLVIQANFEVPFLFLSTPSQQNFIPTSYKGFQQVYEQLSRQFGFKDKRFQKYFNEKGPLKVCIWRGEQEPTYGILQKHFADLNEGFEIQSPQKKFIPWDLPLSDLREKVGVQILPNAYGSNTLSFKYPIRIGRLVIQDMESLLDKNREDVPVLSFYTKCYDPTNTDKSYWELKRYFSEDAGLQPGTGWDRDDQKHAPFNMNGLGMSIGYTYDSEYGFNGGYSLFRIENNRDYPMVLVNEEYERNIEVSTFWALNKNVYIAGNYKKEERIKRRPPQLAKLCGNQPVIWKDGRNEKIGFASKHYAQIFDDHEIVKISIQNTLPGKGAGRSDLEITLQNKSKKHAVLSGGCGDFDEDAQKIEAATGKKVEFLPEMVDA